MSTNPELQTTLDEAVAEVLGLLTGLDLTYMPELDRYRAITRQINRALRANALENEWSFYATTLSLGQPSPGEQEMVLPVNFRARIISDDAVRLVNSDGQPVRWAYFLPRDSLHKYAGRSGLWCAVTRQTLLFSRPLTEGEADLEVVISVMREPKMARLPEAGKAVPNAVRKQLIDFPYPDAITTRAAYLYAQTDPVMQPRVPTLEGGYKDVMYQLMERDKANTDTPYQNDFTLPLENGLYPEYASHWHPHSDY